MKPRWERSNTILEDPVLSYLPYLFFIQPLAIIKPTSPQSNTILWNGMEWCLILELKTKSTGIFKLVYYKFQASRGYTVRPFLQKVTPKAGGVAWLVG